MKLLLFFCIFITGCLDTSDPTEDNPETLPVSSDSLPEGADLPEDDQGEDIPGEEEKKMDLAMILGEEETLPIEGEGYSTKEDEEREEVDEGESSDPLVVIEQPPLPEPAQDKPVDKGMDQDEEGREKDVESAPSSPIVTTVLLPEEEEKEEDLQQEGSEGDSGDESDSDVKPEDDDGSGNEETHVITTIQLPPEEKPVQENTPSETPPEPSNTPPQAQTTRKPGQPSKVKTGNEEKNGIFMLIEDLLTPVRDLFFEPLDEGFPQDPVSSSKTPSSVVTVAVTPPSSNLVEDPKLTNQSQPTSSDVATTTPVSSSAEFQTGQKLNSGADSVPENLEQYQAAEKGLYKFFFTNSTGFLFLGLQKTLSDGREIFLLMEDRNKTHSVLNGQITQDLLSIESQINFLKEEIVGNFSQYLPALCSYHNLLTEENEAEPMELQGHDWLVLSKEFGAFFPDKFHHPFIEDRYIISDVTKDDNGVVKEVILVNKTDDQQTYTLTRNVDRTVSLDSFNVNQEIEEFIVSMEGFFNNQDTLCLSFADSLPLESDT